MSSDVFDYPDSTLAAQSTYGSNDTEYGMREYPIWAYGMTVRRRPRRPSMRIAQSRRYVRPVRLPALDHSSISSVSQLLSCSRLSTSRISRASPSACACSPATFTVGRMRISVYRARWVL